MRGVLRKGCALVIGLCVAMAFLPMAGGPVHAGKTKKTPHLNKTSLSLVQGKTKKLKVKGLEKDAKTGKKPKVTWASSNQKIATVDKKGVVTAKKGGAATVTATVKLSKKKKLILKCSVKVTRLTSANAKKVWKYVKKHGKYETEYEGSWTRTVGGNPAITIDSGIGTNWLEFYYSSKAKNYPYYGTVYMDSLLLNNKFKNKVYVEVQLSDKARDLYTLCGTITGAYDGGSAGISFNSVIDRNGAAYTGFTEEQLAAHKAEATKSVARAFKKYDSLTKKKTGFGMKDIGFTKWK